MKVAWQFKVQSLEKLYGIGLAHQFLKNLIKLTIRWRQKPYKKDFL